jgi:lipopolysaccharide transport protein LptA
MSAANSSHNQPHSGIRLLRNSLKTRFNIRRLRVDYVAGCGFLLLGIPPAVFAQVSEEDLRLPISLDADSTDYDGKNSMLMFRGLRLTQGDIGVQADEGRATRLDFEDSDWHFSGNVVIDTENGHIECDTADLHFSNHQLQIATIKGSPATFEMQRPESEEITYAQAGRVKYNFELGIVEFSDDATITEGGNQISSNYLVYNIAEQRISAQSAADGERVKIKYTPRGPEAGGPTLPTLDEDLSPANDKSTELETTTPDDKSSLPADNPDPTTNKDESP